jgi:hypothetical protein
MLKCSSSSSPPPGCCLLAAEIKTIASVDRAPHFHTIQDVTRSKYSDTHSFLLWGAEKAINVVDVHFLM